MKKMSTKIPLFSKLALKTGIFITPLLISASCYVANEKNYNISLDIENKSSKLSSDVTLHNITQHAKITKPEHINLEFISVTQKNNTLEVEYRIINKDKSKTLPKKVVISGFKDTFSSSSIINPNPISPFNDDNPEKEKKQSLSESYKLNKNKDLDEKYHKALKSSSDITGRLFNESWVDRTVKETDYKLNELTAYPYDLFTIDEDADKNALAQKLDNAINSTIRTKTPGAIALVRGLSRPKANYGWLDGLSINKTIDPKIRERINTHTGDPTIGFFFKQVEKGISVWWHGKKGDKKYILKWRLIKKDGKRGDKVYSQIIDLS
ncbi:Hypothetical protein, predicted lipoprotein [Mycoplasmopsis agalactiae 14628]|uniref:Lipoprotein n=1 Tax=Mycoplasmopsis agalactiae 14628 TaxID=1110504 RepID=I5D5P0_MYCAA|nr:hypothetical protein [Mycoplasmopsis agalactiae]EIN14999.1 Hypothetical protein, predicted lipoprotein [Mycoplasmopsis agalactiae 14628]